MFQAGKCWSALMSVLNSVLPFKHLLLHSPLRLRSSPSLYLRGGFPCVWKPFLLYAPSPRPRSSSQIPLSLFLLSFAAAAAAKSLQSCPTLCNTIGGSPPGSTVPGILQARTLELSCHFLLQCMKVKSESEVAQLCQILRDPMDCSLPGSSVHRICQARVLEWGAIAFSAD